MKVLKWLVGGLVLVALVTVIVWQRQGLARLEAENVALRAQMEQATGDTKVTSATASTIPNDGERSELARLRGEITALRGRTQDLARAQEEIGRLQAQVKLASNSTPAFAKLMMMQGLAPAYTWSNGGFATPATAYQTMHWAKNHGQLETLMNAFVLETGAQAKAEALFATLPEQLRARFDSPQKMVAGLIANSTTVAGMQVLREEDQTADFTRLQVRYQYTDGRVRDDSVQYFRYADGWRQAIPEAVVDKLGRNLQEVMAKQGTQVR